MNFSEEESKDVTVKQKDDKTSKSSSQTKCKLWETLGLELYNSTMYENSVNASKSTPNSYFCLLRDYLINSCNPEQMVQDFNELLKLDASQSLVYWIEQFNSIFFSYFLTGVNARWSSFHEYDIIFILAIF